MTFYSRWKRWDDKGVFGRMIEGLVSEAVVPKRVMIDVSGHTSQVQALPQDHLLAQGAAATCGRKGGERPKRQPGWPNHGWLAHKAGRRHRRQRPPAPLLHGWRPRLAATPVRPPCSAVCRRRNGCQPTGAKVLTRSERRRKKGQSPASHPASHAENPFRTTSSATNNPTGSRSSSRG